MALRKLLAEDSQLSAQIRDILADAAATQVKASNVVRDSTIRGSVIQAGTIMCSGWHRLRLRRVTSFRVAEAGVAGQAGAGRAHSRCQQARNASFQGQVRLIFSMRARAWRTSRAGRLSSR